MTKIELTEQVDWVLPIANGWTWGTTLDWAWIVDKATAQTISNKRITKRVVIITQAAIPTYNIDNWDIFQITGLAQAITSMTTNRSWTPVEWDMIMFEITDNATPRAITWWPDFVASTNVALPILTVASTTTTALFKYTGSTYKCLAVD